MLSGSKCLLSRSVNPWCHIETDNPLPIEPAELKAYEPALAFRSSVGLPAQPDHRRFDRVRG